MSVDPKTTVDSILEERELQCLDKSLTRSQVQEGYDKWAKEYDNVSFVSFCTVLSVPFLCSVQV